MVTATRAVHVARELALEIRHGRFPVGSALPSEAALAERFGISRPSVREALSALQFGGYVVSRRGAGSVVQSDRPRLAPEEQAAHTWSEVVDILEARLVVEPAAVYLATADPDPAALDAAHELVHGMAIAIEAPDVAGRTDHRVHLAVARVCRNAVLVEQIGTLLQRASGALWQAGQHRTWDDECALRSWNDDHMRLITALSSGHGEQAATIMRHHLRSAARNVLGVDALPPSARRRLELMIAQHHNRQP